MSENSTTTPQAKTKPPSLQSVKNNLAILPNILKRIVFLTLGILALSGILDNLLLLLGWGNIFAATEQILNASM